jgi:PKD domain
MGAIRATAAAVLILFTAVAAVGQCVTTSRLISTKTSNPNLVAGPVAWTGSLLGVAKRQSDVDTALWFAVYDENLETVAPDRLVANDLREIVSLEWTGTEFGVFYRTPSSSMNLQRLSLMGDPIGGPIPITPDRTVYSADEIDVEWSTAADAYVIARNISQGRFKGMWVTYVSRDGTHRTDRRLPVFVSSQANLTLAVTSAGVAGLAYQNQSGGISLVRMTETATPVSNSVTGIAGNYIEIAAQGTRFVIVHNVADGSTTELHWLVVDTSFQIVQPDALLLEGSGDDVYPMALVSAGDELALAYVDAEEREDPLNRQYRLRRFTIDGVTLTDTPFAAAEFSSATRSESVYDFVWTGASYLQAAFRSAPDRLNSHLLRYCPLRATISTDVAAGRPGEPVVFTANPAGGVPSYSYAWTFGDPTRIFRTQSVARTYEEPGSYTATLTVTDNAGATYTTTYTIDVITVRRRAVRR